MDHGLDAAQMSDEIGHHSLGQPERADMNGAIQYGNPGRTVRFENRNIPVPCVGTAVRRTAGCKPGISVVGW